MESLEWLGWIGAGALIASRWQVNLLRSRLLYILATLVLVFYTVDRHVWPLAAANVVLFGIGVMKLRDLLRSGSSAQPSTGYTVLEVDPTDEYLRHTLRVHGQDILDHQPGFVWDGAAPGRHAALVQRGGETVGVILFHDVAEGVAQLELDYVTPRYRDAGPGRYVFFDSGFFGSRGYRTVLTPPGMHQAYYAKLGLEQDDDRYVHHVR